MNYQKIDNILAMVERFVLPLAEQGVKMTGNVEDDLVVAFFEGGIPAVRKKLEELEAKKQTTQQGQ